MNRHGLVRGVRDGGISIAVRTECALLDMSGTLVSDQTATIAVTARGQTVTMNRCT